MKVPAPVILSVLMMLFTSGCRHFSNNPEATPVAAQGNYVGIGNVGGEATNISLAITGPDGAGHLAGSIGYRGSITTLSSVLRDSTGDTLRFRYSRNSGQYDAWAIVDASGMRIHFIAPAGIPEFRVNREFGGYNMTGLWTGLMYSVLLQQSRDASMQMGQEGSLFIGTLNVNLVQSAQVQFNSGGYNADSFQITGTMRIAGTDYAFQAAGSYANRDSIGGTWQAGDGGALDHGTFGFSRSFE